MKEYVAGCTKLYQSADVHKEREYNIPEYVSKIEKKFFKRRLFRELAETYGAAKGLEGIIILDAHGYDKPWVFNDGLKVCSVQKWLKRNDGLATAILLYVCNPENCAITSEKSIIIHSFRDITFDNKGDPCTFAPRLYLPKYGYIENSRKMIKEAIEEMNYSRLLKTQLKSLSGDLIPRRERSHSLIWTSSVSGLTK